MINDLIDSLNRLEDIKASIQIHNGALVFYVLYRQEELILSNTLQPVLEFLSEHGVEYECLSMLQS